MKHYYHTRAAMQAPLNPSEFRVSSRGETVEPGLVASRGNWLLLIHYWILAVVSAGLFIEFITSGRGL